MATNTMSEQDAKQFADKLEAFAQTLNPSERRFLGVILASAAALRNEVSGYHELDPTGLDIGETAAQVYYQYTDVRQHQG